MPFIQWAKKLNITQLIAIIAIIPLLSTVYFAGQSVLKDLQVSNQAQKLILMTELVIKISNLIHEQQKERALSTAYLASKGEQAKVLLKEQRKKTDSKREAIDQYLASTNIPSINSEFNSIINQRLKQQNKISDTRAQIDAFEIDGDTSYQFFSDLNLQLINIINHLSNLSPNSSITTRLFTYKNFIIAKEKAGKQRAVGADGLVKGKFTPKTMQQFIQLTNTQNNYLDIFLAYASSEDIAYFNNIMQKQYVIKANEMKELIYAKGLSGEISSFTGFDWYRTITEKINGLKQVEDFIANNLKQNALDIVAQSESQKNKTLMIVLSSSILVIFITILFISSVNRLIKQIFNYTTNLAKGNFNAPLPKQENDEIAKITSALKILRDNGIEQASLKQALVSHKDQLQIEVYKQTAELRELNAELEEFSYRTSHDLKSPIVSAVKLLELTQKSIKNNDLDKGLVSLELAETSLQKLTYLIDDILKIAQIKNFKEDNSEIDILSIINATKTKLYYLDGYSNIQWSEQINHKQKLISQSIQISMIIENLISNAIKYQDPNKPKSYVKIRTFVEDNDFTFEIEDNGLGIPQNHQKKLFTMFRRFHPRVSYGSGLGLYLMKKSLSRLNGEISFEQKPDGSIFRFTLPLIKD